MIKKTARTSKQTNDPAGCTGSKRAAKKSSPAPLNKSETIQTLLARPQGATISELSGATGWQAHSVRGYLSGKLKKKLGLTLDSSVGEDGRRYRLAKRVNS